MRKVLNPIDVEKVYKFMKDNKLTKKEFAKRCGFCVRTLNRYLGKYACGYLSGADKIRKVMGIELYEIFKDEPIENFFIEE